MPFMHQKEMEKAKRSVKKVRKITIYINRRNNISQKNFFSEKDKFTYLVSRFYKKHISCGRKKVSKKNVKKIRKRVDTKSD